MLQGWEGMCALVPYCGGVVLGRWGLFPGGTMVLPLPAANILDFPRDGWCGAWGGGDEVPAWEPDATIIPKKLLTTRELGVGALLGAVTAPPRHLPVLLLLLFTL